MAREECSDGESMIVKSISGSAGRGAATVFRESPPQAARRST
jgi:hypothetical protein